MMSPVRALWRLASGVAADLICDSTTAIASVAVRASFAVRPARHLLPLISSAMTDLVRFFLRALFESLRAIQTVSEQYFYRDFR